LVLSVMGSRNNGPHLNRNSPVMPRGGSRLTLRVSHKRNRPLTANGLPDATQSMFCPMHLPCSHQRAAKTALREGFVPLLIHLREICPQASLPVVPRDISVADFPDVHGLQRPRGPPGSWHRYVDSLGLSLSNLATSISCSGSPSRHPGWKTRPATTVGGWGNPQRYLQVGLSGCYLERSDLRPRRPIIVD
jgi:hypothetical protein